MEKTLQNFLGIDSENSVIDIKLSIENNRSTPEDLLSQVKKVIDADNEGILTDFVDYWFMSNLNKIQKDAVSSAQILLQDYFQKNNIQLASFKPIAITTEKKHSGWAGSVDSVTVGLKNIASQAIGKEIFIREFDEEYAADIQGFLIEYTEHAVIYVNRGLNFCWRRFIVAKELSHLLMNKALPSLRLQDMSKINELLSVLLSPSIEPSTEAQISEYMAYFGALELLLPKQYIDIRLLARNDAEIADLIRSPIQAARLRKREINTFSDLYSSFNVELSRMSSLFK